VRKRLLRNRESKEPLEKGTFLGLCPHPLLGARGTAVCDLLQTNRNVADSAALDFKMITSYVVRGSTGKKDSKTTGNIRRNLYARPLLSGETSAVRAQAS
jgi:hypothetical protein